MDDRLGTYSNPWEDHILAAEMNSNIAHRAEQGRGNSSSIQDPRAQDNQDNVTDDNGLGLPPLAEGVSYLDATGHRLSGLQHIGDHSGISGPDPADNLDMTERWWRRVISARGNRMLIGTAAAGLIALLITIYISLAGGNGGGGGIAVTPNAPALDSTPGGQVQQGSPHYQQTLETANDRLYKDALQAGDEAFMPTVETTPEARDTGDGQEDVTLPVIDRGDPLPGTIKDEGTVTTWTSPTPAAVDAGDATQSDEAGDAASTTAVSSSQPTGDFSAAGDFPATWSDLASPLAPDDNGGSGPALLVRQPAFDQPVGGGMIATSPVVLFLDALSETPPPRMGSEWFPAPLPKDTAVLRQPVAVPDVTSPVPALPIRPGDMLHAVMLAGLHSDLPGPAMAEIVQDPLRGARVFGTFTTSIEAGGLLLEFTRLVTGEGEQYPVQAYALSATEGSVAILSRIDHRLLRRIGIPAFTAMLGGVAALQAREGEQVTRSGDIVTVDQGSIDRKRLLAAGISAAAGPVARVLAESAPAGPAIMLDAGEPVIVLFVDMHRPDGPAPGSSATVTPLPTDVIDTVVPGFGGAAELLQSLPPAR